MKPLNTTHAVILAAADMLEAHEAVKLAEKVRAYAQRNIPDVPLYEEEEHAAPPEVSAAAALPDDKGKA